jgi:hypothetical protein
MGFVSHKGEHNYTVFEFSEKNDAEDMMIARHIVNMHRLKDDNSNRKFSKE